MGKSSSRNKKSRRLSLGKRSRSSSKRTKSKKVHRRNDSLSYSGTSISVSSSSSEDSYRSRRGRSRTQKDSKGTKKRAHKQSDSPQSNDSYSCKRKREGLKRRNEYKEKEKTNTRKKRKKSPSITSTSGSDCSEESEFERHRGRPRRKENHKRKLEKVKSGRKKSRYRSRSCSSANQCSQDSYRQIEEEIADEKHSRRLRSVIVVVGDEIEPKEGKDGHKEEITYDRDDYPCRSNDSNDGGSKREIDSYSHVASKIESVVENEKGEKGEVISYVRNSKLMDMEKDYEFQNEGSGTSQDGVGTKDPTNDSINGNDLESILRQKALENLKRFKGRIQTSDTKNPTNQKDESVDTKQPSIDKVESVYVIRQDSMLSRGKTSDRSGHSSEFKNNTFQSDQMDVAGNSDKKGDLAVCSEINKTNVVISRHGLSKNDSPLKQPHASQEPIQAKPEETNNECGSGAPEPASSVCSISRENSLSKSQGETQESSQFEQKTMSVMQGGEMVQVSYKVYIPKKAPALSRRQLKH